MAMRATPEMIKEYVSREMAIFDQLPACVRKVFSEHSMPASAHHIFTNNPDAFELAKAQPEYFAHILKQKLDQAQHVTASRTRAEIRRMMAEYAGNQIA